MRFRSMPSRPGFGPKITIPTNQELFWNTRITPHIIQLTITKRAMQYLVFKDVTFPSSNRFEARRLEFKSSSSSSQR